MRKSTVHYIAPSTISVTPNANGSADDLAVYVMRGARIKVCSKGVPELVIDAATNSFMEWSFAGRNRRLADSARPYTIYARLSKTDVSDGYLVFAAKEGEGQDWLDKYPYVTPEGLAGDTAGYGTGNYWYIRLGDVSLPENGRRTVTLDTGVLGTDVFNADWYLNPDRNPLRVELSCTIGNQEKGRTPYVCWGESVVLTASLVEGWESDASGKVDHWTISRDTGNADSDAAWNAVDRSETFGATGIITLAHNRGGDHFAGAVAATFTVKAWGEPEAQEPLAETVITILAETEETYSLEASDAAVTYNPLTQSYSPSGGVTFRIRAKAQDGSVSYLSQQQIQAALLHVYYLPADEEAGEDPVPELTFVNGTATLPVSAFSDGKSVNLWIENDAQAVLDRATVAYVRFGEKGDAPVTCYRWYRKGLTPLVPTDVTSEEPSPTSGDASGAANVYPLDKWSRTSPNRPSTGDWLLWMCESIHHGSGTIDAWHGPVRVSAEDGDPGADSSDREYIYKGLATYPFSGTLPANITTDTGGTERTAEYIATHDDFVPQGWSDTAIPTDDTNNKYVYIAIREKAAGHNQQWGAFSAPALWSNWGMQGIDGDGVQYLYKLFDHELSDAERTSSIPANATFNNTTKEWEAAGWSDDPQAPTSAMPFCYCSIIQKLNGQWQTITGGYGRFQKLGLWSKWADDAVNYRLIVRPDGIIVDTTTGSVTNGDFTVEVWRTAGNGEDEHVQDLDDYGLSIVAGARGEEPDLSGETRTAVITRGGDEPQTDFESMLAQFRAVSVSPGNIANIGEVVTPLTYDWLSACWQCADDEWENNTHGLFSDDTYPLLYNYRGQNDNYKGIAYNAMQSWLMAMCLAELVPSKDITSSRTNNQTRLFGKAWEIGSGDRAPIYGSYRIDADPMIGRYAASGVYGIMRNMKTFEQMSQMRAELGWTFRYGGVDYRFIKISKWSYSATDQANTWRADIGYVGEDGEEATQVGWLVNTSAFIPIAPGPFITNRPSKAFPSQYGAALFNQETRNYLVDEAVDAWMCDNYILSANNGVAGNAGVKEQSYITAWNGYDTVKKNRIIQAAAAARCTDEYFFGAKKYISYNGVEQVQAKYDLAGHMRPYWYHRFSEIQSSSDFHIMSPFGDVNGIMLVSDAFLFVKTVMMLVDNCRYPTFLPQLGRRRPGGGDSANYDTTSARNPNEGNKLNCLYNVDISVIIKGSNGYSAEGGMVTERPKSYPSGHAAQAWALAMLFAQMDPDNIANYFRGGYEVGVDRTLTRYHWNSDVIYGRLFATMMMPIINAMSPNDGIDYYNVAKDALGGTVGGGSADVIPYGGSSDSIIIKFVNETGSAVTFQRYVRFNLAWSASDGFEIGPVVYEHRDENNITLAAGATSEEFEVSVASLSAYLGKTFATRAQMDAYMAWLSAQGYSVTELPANITMIDANNNYVSAVADVSTSETFRGGATYTIKIGGTESTVVDGGGGGSSDKITVKIVNKSGSVLKIGHEVNFILNNGTAASPSPVRTGRIRISSLDTNDIAANGGVFTSPEITLSGNALNYANNRLPFSPKTHPNDAEGKYFHVDNDGFYSNILIYDKDGGAHTIKAPIMASDKQFQKGATYLIEYGGTGGGGGGGGGGTTGNDVDVTITIVNNSGSAKTFSGKVCFITYGTYSGYTGYFRIKGYCAEGSNLTIPSGGQRTYAVTFKADGSQTPSVAIGMHFASQAQRAQFQSNNAYYIDISAFTCEDFSTSDTFRRGATYTMVIPTNTHEWSSTT